MSTEKKAASSLVTAHLRSALVILALSIHSLFEGMAVGKLHYNVVVAVVLLLLVLFLIMVILALSIHSLFEGRAVGVLHYNVVVAVLIAVVVGIVFYNALVILAVRESIYESTVVI